MTSDTLRTAIQGALWLLVQGEYEALFNLTHGQRLSEDQIRRAIEDYGRTLVMPPEGLPPSLELYEVEGSDPRQVKADVDLWTVDEGWSDLTLQLTLTENRMGLWGVRIDGIHVL